MYFGTRALYLYNLELHVGYLPTFYSVFVVTVTKVARLETNQSQFPCLACTDLANKSDYDS